MTSEYQPTLWLETAPGHRSPHPLRQGSVIVGRHEQADVSIASNHVSRRHAELLWDGRSMWIRDLGSRNGTTLNGEHVVDWTAVQAGDVVRFGPVHAVVRFDATGLRPSARRDHVDFDQPEAEVAATVSAGSRLSQVPIFVSHSSKDKREARAIASYLRSRGWSVWIDEAGIAGGKDWRSELIRALEGTWVVVLLVSYASMQSKWVVREILAADRLGLHIIPVAVDDAPYPDALRMILSGVQQIDAMQMHDSDRRNQQLGRLDDALILAAQNVGRTKPGKAQIRTGSVIRAVGVIGLLIGFGLFVYLGVLEVSAPPTFDGGIPRPFIGWGIFLISMIVAAIGEGIRRSGMRKGI